MSETSIPSINVHMTRQIHTVNPEPPPTVKEIDWEAVGLSIGFAAAAVVHIILLFTMAQCEVSARNDNRGGFAFLDFLVTAGCIASVCGLTWKIARDAFLKKGV